MRSLMRDGAVARTLQKYGLFISDSSYNDLTNNRVWVADPDYATGYLITHVGTNTSNNESGNTLSGEHWTKSAGSMADCVLPFAGSTYADCDFHLPVPVSFPASASGTDNVFDHGSTGGTFY